MAFEWSHEMAVSIYLLRSQALALVALVALVSLQALEAHLEARLAFSPLVSSLVAHLVSSLKTHQLSSWTSCADA